MYKLSSIIVFILLFLHSYGQQSPHGEGFKIDCTTCHTTDGWKVSVTKMDFDHNSTAFKLTGQHKEVNCKSCHETLKFDQAKSECFQCHTDLHQNTLGTDCARCHTTKSWIVTNTNTIHQLSRFPLQGNHALAECASCHKSASGFRYEPLSVECINCHRTDYLATTAPNHAQLGYSTNCTDCHGIQSRSWNASTFEHEFFPLTGGHSISCTDCHTGGTFHKISNECVTCHQTNFNAAQTPNHSKAGISSDCKTCHTTTAWQPSLFKHSTTGFELTGAHAAIVQCSSCHIGSTSTASSQCISCHQVQYNTAQTPNHSKAGISSDCKTCHTTTAWQPSLFKHSTTGFDLTGAHATIVQCSSCHQGSTSTANSQCISCHQVQYNTAQTPNHSKAGISSDCKTCHTTTAWQPSSFKHSTMGFELTGAHAAIVQCSSCHIGSTSTAGTQCVSCHQVQYNTAKDHVASKFSTDCMRCHNSTNWLQITFNHSTGAFPLTGAHTTVDCASCHANGYVGISTECSSCHTKDFNQAANPNHKTLGLPLSCKDCHTTNSSWQPATFPIHGHYYVLSGAHATIANDCAACHKGVYTNTPKTCYACHTTDYNKTTNPSHATAQFSTDCITCHTNKAWVPSTFNHSNYFPITSGTHNLSCTTCHTTPTNYSVFNCVTSSCHTNAHNQDQGSTGCYRCHPTGRNN